jgi:hypothetical protein
VDEVLAVGDKEFAMKCYQKMSEIKKTGTTIILVSHNEYTIREMTQNCLYIDKGKMRFFGPSEEGINLYLRQVFEDKAKESPLGEIRKLESSKKADIVSLKFFDREWNEVSFIESGQELNIILECIVHERLNNPIFGVNFYDDNGFMYCANSNYEGVTFNKIPFAQTKIKINIPHLHLPYNNYLCSAVIAEETADNLVDWQDKAYRFVIGRAKNSRGSLKLPTNWDIESS